jgi:hypothetical protein
MSLSYERRCGGLVGGSVPVSDLSPTGGVDPGLPCLTHVEEVEKLSWGQLLYLAGEHADDLGFNGVAPKPSQP